MVTEVIAESSCDTLIFVKVKTRRDKSHKLDSFESLDMIESVLESDSREEHDGMSSWSKYMCKRNQLLWINRVLSERLWYCTYLGHIGFWVVGSNVLKCSRCREPYTSPGDREHEIDCEECQKSQNWQLTVTDFLYFHHCSATQESKYIVRGICREMLQDITQAQTTNERYLVAEYSG